MPTTPQQHAETFVNPGEDLEKQAQVVVLTGIIQDHATEANLTLLDRIQELEGRLGQARQALDAIRASAQAVLNANTNQARATAFQALSATIQNLKTGIN